MKEIDWSKAPEWATGYGLMNGSFGIEEVWFNDKQYLPLQSQGGYGPYPFGGGTGPHMHNATKSQIAFQRHRPAPWSGEGLPPVGTVCEAWHNGCAQGVVQVRYSGGCMVLWNVKLKHEQCSASENYTFKPIRTPEQIAAEEREKAIKEMLALDPYLPGTQLGMMSRADFCRTLHDAGYRKVTP
ncbi:hypothetical protein ACQKEK_02325 [Pseudomonas sp. NPDC077408]|uniref:hypothetical protein n=1 Tax=Streptomyces parvus TaxID=66428 RepID=UPI003719088D